MPPVRSILLTLGCVLALVASCGPAGPASEADAAAEVSAKALVAEARDLLVPRSRSDLPKAVERFREATETDGSLAEAWSGLASSSALSALYGVLPPDEALREALAAARRALELEDDLGEAWAALGLALYLGEHDYLQAEAAWNRAHELEPELADVWHWHSMLRIATGATEDARAEALQLLDRALEISPDSALLSTKRGTVLTATGRFDDAETWLDDVRERFPEYGLAWRETGLLELRRDRPARAVEPLRRAVELTGPGTLADGALGYALARTGEHREAKALLAELERIGAERWVSPMAKAWIRVGLGEHARAIEALEHAEALGDPSLVYLRVKPGFDDLAAGPQAEAYRRVLDRLDLPAPA